MTKRFKNMSKQEKFEFMEKKGYPKLWNWLRLLCTECQSEFWAYYNRDTRKNYIQAHIDECIGESDEKIQEHAAIIALSGSDLKEEFLQKMEEIKNQESQK